MERGEEVRQQTNVNRLGEETHTYIYLTIVQVLLDVDIVEEEIEEFYREILEYVDKLDLVIPSMDILDRTTRE